MKKFLGASVLALALATASAQAQQVSVKIGVLTDMSSLYADLSGQGSVIAARMAVEDFGMPLNLMLGCAARLVPAAEDAIALLAAFFAEHRPTPASPPEGRFDRWLRARLQDEAAPVDAIA